MSAVLTLPEQIDAAERADAPVWLSDLSMMVDARIVAVHAPTAAGGAELPERLGELGFLVGERVRVLARAPFGDPIAVRVGSGTRSPCAAPRPTACRSCRGTRLLDECRRGAAGRPRR